MGKVKTISEAVTVTVGQKLRIHSSYGYDCGSGMIEVLEILEPNPDDKEIQDVIEQMVGQYNDFGKIPFEQLGRDSKMIVGYYYSTYWVRFKNLDEEQQKHYGETNVLPLDVFVSHTTSI